MSLEPPSATISNEQKKQNKSATLRFCSVFFELVRNAHEYDRVETMKFGLATILAILALLVTGCETTSSYIKPSDSLDPSKGILLVSVTSDSALGVSDASFYIAKADSDKRERMEAFGSGFTLKKIDDFKDESDRDGRLLAISLAPGEYSVTSWTLFVDRVGAYGYIYPREPPPPLPFSVEKAKVTYIGNLHLETVMGRNVFGVPMPFGANPIALSRGVEDLAVFREKFPKMASLPLIYQLADIALWRTN